MKMTANLRGIPKDLCQTEFWSLDVMFKETVSAVMEG